MRFFDLAGAILHGNRDIDTFDELARAALAEGEEERALELLAPAAEQARHALLWQWSGLLQRSIDHHDKAMISFANASAIAPDDPGIAHGRARVALEAGIDAVDLFLRARTLAPNDGAVALGLAAARHAMGDGETAVGELRQLLERAPAWIDGYVHLGQLLSLLGQRERSTEALEQAIMIFPREPALWTTLFDLSVRRVDFEALATDLARAERTGVEPLSLAPYHAIVAGELQNELFPDELFAMSHFDDGLSIWRIRHLLRLGAVEHALPIIDRELESERAASIWPYASLAWRAGGDPRSMWLEGDPQLVREYDLTNALPPLDELTGFLRNLHHSKGEYLDQSVRGGTQTDGPLLSRIDPPIVRVRAAIEQAIRSYVADLPHADRRHPLLSGRRDRRIRFSGSWSVRLPAGGRHTNHTHPEGWISSALYLSVPDPRPHDQQHAGWLVLGAPDEKLPLQLEPRLRIEPKEGHLVLFPSWMWHGTTPFSSGERMTISFDVARPY